MAKGAANCLLCLGFRPGTLRFFCQPFPHPAEEYFVPDRSFGSWTVEIPKLSPLDTHRRETCKLAFIRGMRGVRQISERCETANTKPIEFQVSGFESPVQAERSARQGSRRSAC